jgi:branched-subunit amino acid transport protein
METSYILAGIAVMAFTTYLIRVLPMVIFRKKITNVWVRSFLFYVPYAVLAAMTFPAVFSSTGSTAGAIAGCVVAVVLAFFDKGLLTVAVCAAAAAFVVQIL